MVDEIREARKHWDFKRVRFDDEVFNFQKDWLEEFCEIYPREIGLPFEIFIEPKLVREDRMRALRDAGLVSVYMGIQSSERVTGHLYDRRVRNQTIEDIAHLYKRLGIKPHFQLIFDDPVSTEEDKAALQDDLRISFRPYDLYLFSMTVFPGSEPRPEAGRERRHLRVRRRGQEHASVLPAPGQPRVPEAGGGDLLDRAHSDAVQGFHPAQSAQGPLEI